MTSKLSDISSWQFVFWDNGRYLVSLNVLKHSLTPCKSNSEVFIFIQLAMNIFYKAIIEPPIFPSLPTSYRIVISFVWDCSLAQKHILLLHNGRIITFIFTHCENETSGNDGTLFVLKK